ncbi:MAG TPA: UvrD-helicase domain-containing protein [Hyphomicrobiaceae bacterium]|jgi:hypothetical protein
MGPSRKKHPPEPAIAAPAPTAEQEDAIAKFLTGESLIVNAFAGSGKTTTLVQMANATSRRGLYVPFNKSTAADAKKKFPGRVKCSTQHGLATHNAFKLGYGPKMFGKANGGMVAQALSLEARNFAIPGSPLPVRLSKRAYGGLVAETVERWCQSGDDNVSPMHAPKLPGKLDALPPNDKAVFKKDLAERAQHLWARMIDTAHDMPLGHDGYLKLFVLQRPILDADYIAVDEFQDSNDLILGLLRHQQAQIVAVGDPYQQIYGWRGSVNAMTKLEAKHEANLTTSWRFGPAVAGYANAVLRMLGAKMPLMGNPERQSLICEIDQPHCILARTNATIVGLAIEYLTKGIVPFVQGGIGVGGYITATEMLQAGKPADFPADFFGYANWNDLQQAAEKGDDPDLASWVSLVNKFGLPALKSAADQVAKEPGHSPITLSTGHKAKGAEWDRVRLCDDFLRNVKKGDDGGLPSPGSFAEELRLLYVAATRAKEQLEIPEGLAIKFNLLRGIA